MAPRSEASNGMANFTLAKPDPFATVSSGMTGSLYSRRKSWPLERVVVRLRQQRIHAKDCAECERTTEGFVHRIERAVTVEGDLTDEQRARLLEIAHKCPVHKTLVSEIVVAELSD